MSRLAAATRARSPVGNSCSIVREDCRIRSGCRTSGSGSSAGRTVRPRRRRSRRGPCRPHRLRRRRARARRPRLQSSCSFSSPFWIRNSCARSEHVRECRPQLLPWSTSGGTIRKPIPVSVPRSTMYRTRIASQRGNRVVPIGSDLLTLNQADDWAEADREQATDVNEQQHIADEERAPAHDGRERRHPDRPEISDFWAARFGRHLPGPAREERRA